MNTGIQDTWLLGWKLERVLKKAPRTTADLRGRAPSSPPSWASARDSTKQYPPRPKKACRDSIATPVEFRTKKCRWANIPLKLRSNFFAGDRAPGTPGEDATSKPVRLFDFSGPAFRFSVHSSHWRAATQNRSGDINAVTSSHLDPPKICPPTPRSSWTQRAFRRNPRRALDEIYAHPDPTRLWTGLEQVFAGDLRTYLAISAEVDG